ncbi:hypothetical protein [Polaribacter sp. R77954]|uniref:hypothetical protein n=1 Tax=Polaribacter sp. R77954 TaxID=3093870 RepID=UPI0037C79C22
MKKSILLLTLIALFTFSSCTDEVDEEEVNISSYIDGNDLFEGKELVDNKYYVL